jgi:hypothetical protein
MTARRLLIVMLVLLGISTLAAALVPQRTLRRDTTTGTTQTQAVRPPPPPAAAGRSLIARITVGGKKVPVVAGPVCGAARKSRCEPIQVGDQVTLLVSSRFPTQLEIPEFGLVGFATSQTPARFELLPDAPNTIGVLFAPKRKVAARVEVLSAKEAAKPRSAARGGSGRP